MIIIIVSLYVLGVVITFLVAPLFWNFKNSSGELVVWSWIFPLFWAIVTVGETWNMFNKLAEIYLKHLEKRNEK